MKNICFTFLALFVFNSSMASEVSVYKISADLNLGELAQSKIIDPTDISLANDWSIRLYDTEKTTERSILGNLKSTNSILSSNRKTQVTGAHGKVVDNNILHIEQIYQTEKNFLSVNLLMIEQDNLWNDEFLIGSIALLPEENSSEYILARSEDKVISKIKITEEVSGTYTVESEEGVSIYQTNLTLSQVETIRKTLTQVVLRMKIERSSTIRSTK